jgi:hypothetical protein
VGLGLLIGTAVIAVLALLAWKPRPQEVDAQQSSDAVVLNELDGTCRDLRQGFTTDDSPPVTTADAVALIAGRRQQLLDAARDRLGALRPSATTRRAVDDVTRALATAAVTASTAAALAQQGLAERSLTMVQQLEQPVERSFAAAAEAGATGCDTSR